MKITGIKPATEGGQLVAEVEVDAGQMVDVAYWPELLEQWGAEPLRAWVLQQASDLSAATPATPIHESHAAALVGEGQPAVVCRQGEIGCTEAHEPEPPESGVESGNG